MKQGHRGSGGSGGSVRIVGGQWRGTRLPVADAQGLRPTSDRVRETLFNWLQPLLPGARVLDLFAGSGALGIEAVSRGAREALLVERDPALAQSLRESVERLKAGDCLHVIRADALAWLRVPMAGVFDGVFLDPPFESDAWTQALDLLAPWLAQDAWLYLETPLALDAARLGRTLSGWQPHRVGETREVRYALYRRRVDPAATLGLDSSPDGATTPA